MDEQLTALQRAEREAARAFVAQVEALQEVWDTAPADTKMGRRPHAIAEAAAVLHLHPQTVEGRLAVADTLQEHPVLRSLLLTGRLGVSHVLAVDSELRGLGDPTLAGRTLREVLLTGGRLGWDGTPSELRRALGRAAVRLDPQAAERRRLEQTRARTGVRLKAQPDGLASWTATGEGTALSAADRMLDALSRSAGPDDERTRGQRQLDALLGALAARTGGVPLELQLGIPVQVTGMNAVPGCTPEPLRIVADLTPELLALLATDTRERVDDDKPAEPTVETPTEKLAAPVEEPATAVEEPPAPARTEPALEQPRRHRVRRDGVAELVDLGPIDAALLAQLLTDPHGMPLGIRHVQLRRTCLDRTGQVVAVDDRAVPLESVLAPPGELLNRLITDLPAPPPMTTAHDPTAAQARVVRACHPRCTFPGCLRRARRCDLDHRTRHPDGATSVVNLHPLCAHHHHLKHDGWTCTYDADGTTHWTSPRGQHLTVQRC